MNSTILVPLLPPADSCFNSSALLSLSKDPVRVRIDFAEETQIVPHVEEFMVAAHAGEVVIYREIPESAHVRRGAVSSLDMRFANQTHREYTRQHFSTQCIAVSQS
jgi:hypothetical protein